MLDLPTLPARVPSSELSTVAKKALFVSQSHNLLDLQSGGFGLFS